MADSEAAVDVGLGGEEDKKAPCLLVIGMAGSGKTSLLQRLNAHLHQHKNPCYVVNLDPAVTNLPYEANVDIRDTVKYKEVMKQFSLGPNGAIVTSLNLFTTRFDQVLGLLEKRSLENDYVLLDTPGQIEVFTWSASGQIITEALASTFPTVAVYVIDTPRCISPVTFMSNMLYACSILYKTKLPFVLAFNKTDIVSHQFAVEWMTDFESFQDAISKETSYAASLTRSMSLVLEEFYENLRAVGVSAHTGAGMEEFFAAIDEAVEEYHADYVPMQEKLRAEKVARETQERLSKEQQFQADLRLGGDVVLDATKGPATVDNSRADKDEDDDEDS